VSCGRAALAPGLAGRAGTWLRGDGGLFAKAPREEVGTGLGVLEPEEVKPRWDKSWAGSRAGEALMLLTLPWLRSGAVPVPGDPPRVQLAW